MKKILLLISVLLLASCSADEEPTCICELEVIIAGHTSFYYITGIESDCNGGYDVNSIDLPKDHFIVGLTNCN